MAKYVYDSNGHEIFRITKYGYECPHCGFKPSCNFYADDPVDKYCPACGKKMNEEITGAEYARKD